MPPKKAKPSPDLGYPYYFRYDMQSLVDVDVLGSWRRGIVIGLMVTQYGRKMYWVKHFGAVGGVQLNDWYYEESVRPRQE